MTNQNVLLTGANGFLGSRTVRCLLARGYGVRCLVRESSDLSRLRDLPIEFRRGDVRDPTSLAEAARGCDAILHLAGISAWHQIRDQADQLDPILINGTRNVLQAASEAGVRRVVYVSSSVAIDGTSTPEILNERSPYRLQDSGLTYSLAKHRAELEVERAARELGLETVIVNPCELYGEDDYGMVTAGNIETLIAGPIALLCRGGTSVAHVADVAQGIVLALERGRSGERYLLGGDNLELSELARIARRSAGKPTLSITLPNSWVRALCVSLETLGLNAPVPLDVLEYATRYWFVDSSKARNELGYSPRPASAAIEEVVAWLKRRQQTSRRGLLSLRYGGGRFDPRSALIRLFGLFQRKKVVILRSDPELCGAILASSDTKGTFVEQLLATPAWAPVYSIESMDGPIWKQLAADFRHVMGALKWRERLTPIAQKEGRRLGEACRQQPSRIVDAEQISRTTLRILHELLFSRELGPEDEDLFYRASLEWRKEIAVKGPANSEIKQRFMDRLRSLVEQSEFRGGLETYSSDPSQWLSVFAQPFLISPQINVSDIFTSVFHFLRSDETLLGQARAWSRTGDRARLGGILLESMRLQHPFPILEREILSDQVIQGRKFSAGTQVIMLFDQFEQTSRFDPERWLAPPADNPFHAMPFAAGPRMCTGKPIAMELMTELLRVLLTDFDFARVRPDQGHLYSGRDNDGKTTFAETRYQLKTFARGLKQSLSIDGRCPFHRSPR